MSDVKQPNCPECVEGVGRREFMLAGTAGLLAAGTLGSTATLVRGDEQPARQAKPAEALIQELFSGLTADQKRQVVFPWNDARRRGMFNAAFAAKIGDAYTRPQQELNQRILRAISSGEDGLAKLTRGGTYDGSQNFNNCGAYIFGDPSNNNNRQFAWVFAGHHLTVRCDGNSEAGTAFGGPMYYGHSPDGWSNRNLFHYQTRSVQSVYEALNENQRRAATITGNLPGEGPNSIRFRDAGQAVPGVAGRDLTADQRRLVETVMRDILNPYRREDADEVMQIVQRNGGMERIHLAFHRDQGSTDTNRWHFWRLEGPGFVWNFRVLPHVHTFVNIAQVAAPPAQG